MTMRQKKREQMAQLCDEVSRRFDGKKSQSALRLRATNRRVDLRKSTQKTK